MFDNIGRKIKGLAKCLCWIGIVFSVISGIIVLVDGLILAGLLRIAIGVLASWGGSLYIYGYGELIVSHEENAYYTSEISKHISR